MNKHTVSETHQLWWQSELLHIDYVLPSFHRLSLSQPILIHLLSPARQRLTPEEGGGGKAGQVNIRIVLKLNFWAKQKLILCVTQWEFCYLKATKRSIRNSFLHVFQPVYQHTCIFSLLTWVKSNSLVVSHPFDLISRNRKLGQMHSIRDIVPSSCPLRKRIIP